MIKMENKKQKVIDIFEDNRSVMRIIFAGLSLLGQRANPSFNDSSEANSKKAWEDADNMMKHIPEESPK